MNCQHCRKIVQSKFCTNCGTKVSEQRRKSCSALNVNSEQYNLILQQISNLPNGKHKKVEFMELCAKYNNDQMGVKEYRKQLKVIVGSDVVDSLLKEIVEIISNSLQRKKLQEWIHARDKRKRQKERLRKNDKAKSMGNLSTPSAKEYRSNGIEDQNASNRASTRNRTFKNSSTATKQRHNSMYTNRENTTKSEERRQSEGGEKIDRNAGSASMWRGPHNWGKENSIKQKGCSICHKEFNWIRRRHQCRMCAGYYCEKDLKYLMIPSDARHVHAKANDGNDTTPQKVCLNCAPEIEPMQDMLTKDANQYHENEGKFSRVPYLNNTMEMEVAAAARSVQRFFGTGMFYTGVIKDKYIPAKLIRDAKGLAFFTNYKFGFLVSGAGGTGIAVAKNADGTWSAPIALSVHSLSIGFKAGLEFAYYMLVLRSEKAIEALSKGTIGLDASADIAVGPFGRAATATAAGSSNGVAANLMYAHCRGLYGGISVGGQLLRVRKKVNRAFYGRDIDPGKLFSGEIPPPKAAQPLYDAIASTYTQASEMEDQHFENDNAKTTNTTNDSYNSHDANESYANHTQGRQQNQAYANVIAIVEKRGGESAVKSFKLYCKQYANREYSAKSFCDRIATDLSEKILQKIVPDLSLLITHHDLCEAFVNEAARRTSKSSKKQFPKDAKDILRKSSGQLSHAGIIDRVKLVTQDEEKVKQFKLGCKNYGSGFISASEFYSSIRYMMGPQECALLVPDLAQLIPDDEKRNDLLKMHAQS